MEDPRIEDRKHFMKRKISYQACLFIYIIANYQDPLKKREEFAVSLRKQKNKEIISAKRRRLLDNRDGDESNIINSPIYKQLTGNETEFNNRLKELCPKAIEDMSLSTVKI